MTTARELRIGSLFSGIGGLERGLEWATGGTVVFQAEWDGFCRAVLRKHWPGALRYADVRSIGVFCPRVHVLCGGFPCQPVSVAGSGKAQEDDRWMWPAYRRAIRLLRPAFVFVENVPGLQTAVGGWAFGEVLGDLAALGYDAVWSRFRASDALDDDGRTAPHRRERVFLLAYTNGLGEPQPQGCEPDESGRTFHRGEARLLADAARRRARAAQQRGQRGGLVGGGAGALLADAYGHPLRQQPERLGGFGGEALAGSAGTREPLADADCFGERESEHQALPFAPGGHARPGAGERGGGPAFSRLGGGSHGLPRGLDGAAGRPPHRWPAGRGQPQFPWEPPRTRLVVPRRPQRLKVLGNAVISQVAEHAWNYLYDRMFSEDS